MPRPTRRRFIAAVGAAALAAPDVILSRQPEARLPLAFSTLGCPKWDWATILREAARMGYAAIELRGLQDEMDLTKRPEFAAGRLAGTLRDLDALNLRISDLGASTKLHETDPAGRAAQLDEARRFIDLAHRLRAPYVRVFGDKYVEGEPRRVTIERIARGLRELGTHAKGSGVAVLIESHGDFNDSPTLLALMKEAGIPQVGLLWDAHHTFVAGREEPAETYRQLGRYVRHTHLKDSRPAGKDVRYVLTGAGTVPIRETVRVLVKHNYRGYYSFEWEKRWHPEIEEPEVALPHFAQMIRTYLAEAGVKQTTE